MHVSKGHFFGFGVWMRISILVIDISAYATILGLSLASKALPVDRLSSPLQDILVNMQGRW